MRFPLWRRRQKEELDEEVRGHLDAAIRERVARGESPAQARAAARREFGNVGLVQEVTRDTWGWGSLERLTQDLRYALRGLAARPGFTVVAIASLALGIGANAAIFSLWNGLLFSPLPAVRAPEELVMLTNPNESGSWTGMWEGRTDGPRAWLTYGEFEDLRDHADLFSGVMASQSRLNRWQMRFEDGTEHTANGRLVSGGFFQVLGVSPAIGRLFTAAEDRSDSPVAVISHDFWQRRFGGRPDAVGKTVAIGKAALTIIGVAPAGFIGETAGQQPALWLPLRMQPILLPGKDMLHDTPPEKVMWLHVFGRLKPGVTLAQGEAQANALLQAGMQSFYGAPAIKDRPDFLDQQIKIHSAARGASSKRNQLSGSLQALLAAVGVLLLIVCTNLANLLLARGVARRAEIALRLSLGATRGRLVRQLATESLALAAAGGLAAVAVASFLHDLLVPMLGASDPRFQMSFGLSPLLLTFVLAVTFAAALVFGVLPAWRVTRIDTATYLKEHSRGAAGSQSPLRSGRLLVSLQLALSLPLLAGAGLLARTVYNLKNMDLGYPAQRLLMTRVDLRAAGYEPARRSAFLRQALNQVERLPGVQAASFSELGLFSGGESSETIEVEGFTPKGARERGSATDRVGPGYFTALGVPILLGREILEQDTGNGPKVAVINEAFARKFFAGRNPLGLRITTLEDDGRRTNYQVVGVAQDARITKLRGAIVPRYFVAGNQVPASLTDPAIVVRTTTETPGFLGTVRKTIQGIDQGLPIVSTRSIEEQVVLLTAQERATAQLAAVFGGAALVIAAIGLCGVLSYGISRRTAEIAIRIALGAHPRRVIGMILGETGELVGAGMILGGALAYATLRWIEKQLYGISPQDPVTLALATGLLLLVALAAAYFPARRAARLDPNLALRHE